MVTVGPTPFVPNGSNTVRFQNVRGVVTAQTQFAPAASQADGGTAVEGQALAADGRRCGSREAWLFALVAAPCRRRCRRRLPARRRRTCRRPGLPCHGSRCASCCSRSWSASVLVADIALAVGVGRVNDAEQRDGRLGRSRAGSSQDGQSNQGLFHLQVSPRLNIGLRCEGVTECRHFRAPAGSPGQPPFGKLWLLHQSGLSFAKYLAPANARFVARRQHSTAGSVESAQHRRFFDVHRRA